MSEVLTPEQEQTRALLAPILNPGQSIGLMLGHLALYTDATPPAGSEDPLDYAPTYVELEGPAADWQRVAELFQTAAEYHAAPASAPASQDRGGGGEGALREGLTILLVSAQSAQAARLDQMHSHLDTGHPAAQTDGQAAQIHGLYAQAIAQLLDPADAGAQP